MKRLRELGSKSFFRNPSLRPLSLQKSRAIVGMQSVRTETNDSLKVAIQSYRLQGCGVFSSRAGRI